MRWVLIMLAGFCTISLAASQDMPLSTVLIDGKDWTVVDRGYEKIFDLRFNDKGEVFVSHSQGLKRIEANGSITVMNSESRTPAALGLQVAGWNGVFYSTVNGEILATGADQPRDAKPDHITIPNLGKASGVAVSGDRGTLFVGDASSKWIWALRIEKDGSLTAGQPYAPMRVKGKEPSGVRDLMVDSEGRIYAVTNLGVQIFDPTGRLCGVLSNPSKELLVAIAFGGVNGDRLFVASETTVYSREVKSRGVGFGKPK